MERSRSTIGRLLEEISWEGNARHYRQGGRGFENVLAAEVFQALDFLPRAAFLGRIVQSIQGGDPETVKLLWNEIEEARFTFLPGDIFLGGHSSSSGTARSVQPDGILESTSVYCMLEAKRIKRGAFQPEQLAREMLAVLQEAQGRQPLLLLVLPSPPPVAVCGYGRLSIHDAVSKWLEPVLQQTESEFPAMEELAGRADSVIAYTTWQSISETVAAGKASFVSGDPSVDASISRLAETVLQAIVWHT